MQNEQLNQNWNETKNTLLEGLTPAKREIVGPLLENQKNYMNASLTETAAAGSVAAGDIANFRKTLLPMIRRIIPGTIASELVGVQPMTGPVGLVYTLKYKYEETMAHDPLRSAFGGHDIAEGDEAFGNLKPIRQFYSGSVSTGSPLAGIAQLNGASGMGPSAPGDITAGDAQGTAWGSSSNVQTYGSGTMDFGYEVPVGGSMQGGSGSHVEGVGGRKMSLQVLSQAVEAGSRKLQAGWTVEAMQDLNSQHGLDLENEMTKALSAEIVQEIDAEIINDLLALAGSVTTFDFDATGSPTYAPGFVGDRMANVGPQINWIANEIARKTRRGAGNWIVVSPMMVSVLQSAAKSVFAPAIEGSFKGPNNTMLVGTLNGTIKVYSYLWNQAQPYTTAGDSDVILVGYKGGNGETDCGYFYTPYIPLMSSGVVMNPVTYQPSISLMTRYGKVAFTDGGTSLGNSADYYGKVIVTGMQFS